MRDFHPLVTWVLLACLGGSGLLQAQAEASWCLRGRRYVERQAIQLEPLAPGALDPRGMRYLQGVHLLRQALATARKIPDAWDRVRALSALATAQAQAGQVAEALATARAIPEAWARAKVLSVLATAQAQAGLDPTATFVEALATARKIEGAGDRAPVLIALATAQAQAGQVAAALATAREIPRAYYQARAKALSALATAQTQAGLDPTATFAEVLATVREMPGAGNRAEALSALAIAQAQAGLALSRQGDPQAIETFYRVLVDKQQARTLREMAAVALAAQPEPVKARLKPLEHERLLRVLVEPLGTTSWPESFPHPIKVLFPALLPTLAHGAPMMQALLTHELNRVAQLPRQLAFRERRWLRQLLTRAGSLLTRLPRPAPAPKFPGIEFLPRPARAPLEAPPPEELEAIQADLERLRAQEQLRQAL